MVGLRLRRWEVPRYPADASPSHGAAMTIDIPARMGWRLDPPLLHLPTPTCLGIASAGALDLAAPPRCKLGSGRPASKFLALETDCRDALGMAQSRGTR